MRVHCRWSRPFQSAAVHRFLKFSQETSAKWIVLMTTSDLLNCLRTHPGSFVEIRNDEYYLLDAHGDPLTHDQLTDRQIDALLTEGRITHDGRKRYIFTAHV